MDESGRCRGVEEFLQDYDGKGLSWLNPGKPGTFETDRVLLGNGEHALEVAIATAISKGHPKASDLRTLFRKRQGDRPSPVILVVLYETPGGDPLAAVVGASGDPAPVTGLEISRVERVCAAALEESDRHGAVRTFERHLAGLKDRQSPGIYNSGLFASHELRTGVPARADWSDAGASALPLLGLRGNELIRGLGYQSVPRGSAASVLTHDGHSRAVAVLLTDAEVFDRPSARFGAVTPVAHGLTIAAKEELPWLIVQRGTRIRLYPASPDVGVGRKGQGETYAELDLAVMPGDQAAYLTLLFAPDALRRGGTVEQILASSENFAADLGQRLRTRVYEEVVPALAIAVAGRMNARTENDLAEAYHRTLVILFRLLFLAYAEDRRLLPYERNSRYDRHAVKTLARDFAASPDMSFDANATSLWDDMLIVWKAIDEGNTSWDVPAYNGGLFSRDPETNPSGAALAAMHLTDAEFGPALRSMLVDSGDDGSQGPVDFRSLGVREFGTIYEGLLESELSVAQTDLKVDPKSRAYLPARSGDDVKVPAGQVYIHNKSGERKSTGSYFTKQFAVEHLLDSALEPALDDHLARVAALLDDEDEAAAADAFFDFRVADPAMGSAHFLVAAIDRIEARFTSFLAERPIAAVADELHRLEQAARGALGDQADIAEIETGALLRRQIARRCIYGLDLNLIAVELARVSIWIHTFVPGLPMSSLDHNLVVGNSLTGIATIDEVLDVLEPKRPPGQDTLFTEQLRGALEKARERLVRTAMAAELDKAEVREARRAHIQARRDAADAKSLMDDGIGIRLGLTTQPLSPEQAISDGASETVQKELVKLKAAHLPYLFPEVFLRENPGFDCMLGNPPWEKLQIEAHSFYSLHFPGLRGLDQSQAEREIAHIRAARPDLVAQYERETAATQAIKTTLAKGPYPGFTAGRPDLYKAFAWRLWHVTRRGGYIGVVLPRKALEASGMKDWRRELLTKATFTGVTTLTNTNQWVFDEVHGQYTVGLVTVRADKESAKGRKLRLHGPFHSLDSYRSGAAGGGELDVDAFFEWSESLALPQLPDADALRVFTLMRAQPRLDYDSAGWSVRGLREFNASDDKDKFEFAERSGIWPVYKGESFERWNPETGAVYAWADPASIVGNLQDRRINQVRNRRSAFFQMPASWAADPQTLPALHPRIAWRDIARATDTQTVVAALIPPQTIMVHQAFYLFWREGSAATQAYVLGVLCSLPFDWYARQMVESHVTVEFMRSVPVPRPPEDDPWRQRATEIAGRLAAVDGRYAEWAAEVGVPVGSVTTQEMKDDLVAELDAVVALLYGLERADVEHIFSTFHRGWDYQPRLTAVLGHFDWWSAAREGSAVA